MDKPLISVITVNYNGLEHTIGMLASFQKVTYPHFEIIVVDNASKEDPSPLLDAFPEVKLIKNKENQGFAGGNNRGLEEANGEYFFLINNDTEVFPDVLDNLILRCQNNPKVGLVCPKIRYYESPKIIQFAGYTNINPITGRGKGIGFQEIDKGQYDQAYITHLAHGAAMFIPKKVVEDVGLMAEFFFLYYEELDYCERIKKAGYEIWYEPAACILHKESMSVGKNSLLKTYYMSRNRWVFLRRNVPWPLFLFTASYYFMVAIPKSLVNFAIKREWDHLKAYWRGFMGSFLLKSLHDNPVLKPKVE
ncbi:glycosyltransferase family 2 protein [Pleomorphovibrio marinus]|uniref:glycosyltransferase family 2 protein n=1 Tax=Pleomorphovibrio marinus TaxID=2164132 RepID=UPI000E0A0530|nr:glycosyltransferase family 2 protein [Pleomorphovibrio marinus]